MQNSKSTKDTVNHQEKKGCCNGKCLFAKEELSAMRQQVLELNEMIESLVNNLQIKDAQYNEVRRLNDLLLIELKKKRRSSHMLKQQLEEERTLYSNAKGHLNSRNECNTCCTNIERENKALKQQLIAKSLTTYKLSDKLLEMKHAKDILQSKLDRKATDHIRVMAEMLEKLDEAGKELNAIIPSKFREPLPVSKAKFLQIVQRNARLLYENAVLKAQVHKSVVSRAQSSIVINHDNSILSSSMQKKSAAFSLTNTASKDSMAQAAAGRNFHSNPQAHFTTQHITAREIQTDSHSNLQAEFGNSAKDATWPTMEPRSAAPSTDNAADFSIDSCNSCINK